MSLKSAFQPDPRLPTIPGMVFKITNPTVDTVTGVCKFDFLVYASADQREAQKKAIKGIAAFNKEDATLAKKIKVFEESVQARIDADPDNPDLTTVIETERTQLRIEVAKLQKSKKELETALNDNRAIEQFTTHLTVPSDVDVRETDGDISIKKCYEWAKTLDAFAGSEDI